MKNTVTNLLTLFLFLFVLDSANAQAAGDYRSKLSGSWSAAGNWETFDGSSWNTAVVPPNSSNGVITILIGHNMTLDVHVTVDELVIAAGATLTQAANTMTVNDGPGTDLNCSGMVNFTNGTISGSGSIAFVSSATFIWGGGTINGNGDVVIEAGATLTMNSSNSKTLGGNRSLINKGAANYSSGNLFFQSTVASETSMFLNEGVLDVNDRLIQILAGHSGNAVLKNASTGMINKSGAGTLSLLNINLFSNSGTVNINGGTFSCTPTSTEHKGVLNLSSGTSLNIGNSNHSVQSGAVFNGPGSINNPGGIISLQVPLVLTDVPLKMTSGTINGTGDLTIKTSNTFTWEGGLIGGSGTVLIEPGANLTMNTSGNKTLGGSRSLINRGTANLSGGSFNFQATPASATTLFLNEGNLEVSDRVFQVIGGHVGNAIITNTAAGVITKSGAGVLDFFNFNLFTNSGTVNINGGSFSCTPTTTEHKSVINLAAGTSMTASSGIHLIQSGAAINGPGSISFSVGGTMTLQTDFSLNTAALSINNGATINGSNSLTIAAGNTLTSGAGTVKGSNDVIIAPGATLNITNGLDLYNHKRVINRGVCNWTGGHISFALNTGETAVFQNEGTMNANFNSNLNIQPVGSYNGTKHFNNTVSGVINKNNAGTMSIALGIDFDHLGEFNINGGTFGVSGAYGIQTGNYTLASSTVFSGVALGFKGNHITNNGSVTISGLTFNGTVQQNLNGTGSINSLIINNASGVNLGGTQTINSALTLTNGKMTLGANDLLMSSVASLTGGSSVSYLVTNGVGRFRRRVTNNNTDVLFPIGIATSYLPIRMKLTTGSSTDDFKVRVDDELNSEYSPIGNPVGETITNHVVKRMWLIDEGTAGGSDATVQFNWNVFDEGLLFIRGNINAAQYDGSNWQTSSYGSATGSGPYSFSKSGITSFREFCIADNQAILNAISWYADADGDSFGNPNVSIQSVNKPTGYVLNNTDCADNNFAIHPNASEKCNGFDDDCDALVDDADPGVTGQKTWYLDRDIDGYGNSGSSVIACFQPRGYVSIGGDCNDNDSAIRPNAPERCNGYDDDCDGLVDDADFGVIGATNWYADDDQDGFGDPLDVRYKCIQPTGYVFNNLDCNDADAGIGAPSVWFADSDSDGFGDAGQTTSACAQPSGYVSNDDDCDDTDESIHPNAAEICNDIDDDCDGDIDDADSGITGQASWYADVDGDGFGDANQSILACDQPTGYVGNDDDCDDANVNVHPNAAEVCNTIDDDCDGMIDDADPGITGQDTWYADGDGDGFGDAGQSTLSCDQPSGYVSNDDDCNDSNNSVHPNAAEICNDIDDDCDGDIDDADSGITGQASWYADVDGDGFGDANQATLSCDQPSGYVSNDDDCADTDAGIHPGAVETCNDLDDDCDGLLDDEDPNVTGQVVWYVDADGDGYGDPGTSNTSCDQPAGYVMNADDCDDDNPNIHPGAEICNDIDDDCDGLIDDGLCCDEEDGDGDGVPDAEDNCPTTENSGQEDDDCDGVGNACDYCPGGDDTVDQDLDGQPDCYFLPAYSQILADWKCGSNKVYLAHDNGNGNRSTLCLNYSAAQAHINHGDYLGPVGNSGCGGQLKSNPSNPVGTHEDHLEVWNERNEKAHDHGHQVGLEQLMIFPNPTDQEFVLCDHSGSEAILKVEVSDMFGRKIEGFQTSGHSRKFGAAYRSGVYMVKVMTGKSYKTFILVKND